MPTVSVIVPVYNNKNLLPRCIESILSQTFRDIELILIDDGSSDDSAQICDKYALLDKRVRVILKKHSGVSSTRNYGLNNMSGKYVCFCDADDELPANAVLSLVKANKKSNADLVIGGFASYNIITEVVKPYSSNRTSFIIRNKDELKNNAELLWQQNNMLTSCAKLYDSDIIRSNDIRFNENLTVLEDFDFVLSYLKYVKTIHNIEEYTYNQIVGYKTGFHRPKVDYMDDINYVYEKFIRYLELNSVHISNIIANEIQVQVIILLNVIASIPPQSFTDLIKKRKRAKKVLSFNCVIQSLKNLSSNTYYKTIIDKYGIINWVSGVAVKLKEIDDDYSSIKKEKGPFFAVLWKLKSHMKVYL